MISFKLNLDFDSWKAAYLALSYDTIALVLSRKKKKVYVGIEPFWL